MCDTNFIEESTITLLEYKDFGMSIPVSEYLNNLTEEDLAIINDSGCEL